MAVITKSVSPALEFQVLRSCKSEGKWISIEFVFMMSTSQILSICKDRSVINLAGFGKTQTYAFIASVFTKYFHHSCASLRLLYVIIYSVPLDGYSAPYAFVPVFYFLFLFVTERINLHYQDMPVNCYFIIRNENPILYFVKK
jgi:hypothetical protein